MSWAEDRLARSHDYWLATVTDGSHPHVVPVWAVFLEDRLWFSSSNGSKKARNIAANALCSLTTDDPAEPVIAKGSSERVTDRSALERMLAAENQKYGTDYGMEMVDPAQNSCFAMTIERVIGLASSDFVESPTRWTFG